MTILLKIRLKFYYCYFFFITAPLLTLDIVLNPNISFPLVAIKIAFDVGLIVQRPIIVNPFCRMLRLPSEELTRLVPRLDKALSMGKGFCISFAASLFTLVNEDIVSP
jgi:hypothetical protein